MNITIKAQILAGTDIVEAFTQAIRIARQLKCNIEFNFNDVTCFATPNGDAEKGATEYHKNVDAKSQFKFAHS